ncbi:MAG: hypothetical protein IT580_00415, partial [Verrucomicrobiales bacterium]|nr:hypothetical protein [Verrucomicrobiales bacterium]
PGALRLGGSLTLGAASTIVATGGTLEITGVLNLQTATLTLSPTTGNLVIDSGTLLNGSLVQSGGARLIFSASSQNYLDAIQLTGDLVLTNSNARARVLNGLTLTGGKVRLNANGAIGFEGSQTFGGEVLFEGDSGFVSIDGTTTLTLATTALVHGKTGRIGQAIFTGGTSTLLNQGTIRADVSGGTLTVNPNAFTNSGTLQQINGGTLVAPGFP